MAKGKHRRTMRQPTMWDKTVLLVVGLLFSPSPGLAQTRLKMCDRTWQHNDSVGKPRRGGYIFITWKSDHPPRHVHVCRDGTLVVKWDLDNKKPMKGSATRRVLELIAELESEDAL